MPQASPEILAGWNALHYGLTSTYHPPDVQVAAGPNDVVEMVNLRMGVYTKQGVQLNTTSLYTFFNVPSDYISDPKVQYDAASGRWFTTLTDVTTGQVLIAISATSDPLGHWHFTHLASTASSVCLDQPILGVGSTTVIVSANVFTHTNTNPCTTPYLGAQYWVVSKADLENGVSPPANYTSPIDATQFSLHPVQIEGSSLVHYMVTTFGLATGSTSSAIWMFKVSGTPPGPVTAVPTSFSMPTANVPPAAVQPGATRLDTGDMRISDAAWAAGKLWLGFDEACLSDSTRACIRMVEIDTGTGSMLQDFDINLAGKYVFYPAFRIDGAGSLAVVFGYSSTSDYPGIMWSGRLPGDAVNTIQTPQVIVQGAGADAYAGCTGTCRYGDYFGAGLDPSNASVVWLAGQFETSSDWSTHIFASTVKAVLTLDYNIRDGGSGYSIPSLTYVSNGSIVTATLTIVPTAYCADPGTSWSVVSVISNRAAQGEYWSLNTSLPSPPSAGYANASTVANYTYYHGYQVFLGYAVVNWNPQAAIPSAHVQVFRFGQPAVVLAGESYLLDAGTEYAYENPLRESTPTDRIVSGDSANGTVTGAVNVTVRYYHQVRVTFNYVVVSGSAASAPAVHYVSFGTNTSVVANGTVWADVGQVYVYNESLTPETAGVRVGAGSGTVGDVVAAGTITVAYRIQYRLTVLVEPGRLVGNVSGAGWYDAGAAATLAATAPIGWEFRGWYGNVTGSATSVTVTMDEPLTAIALFYAGLTITAGGGGSVAYAYGGISGTVAAGSSFTIYVPAGTEVNLTASPSSLAQALVAWGGAVNGSSATVSLVVNGPMAASASFGLNTLLVVGGAVGIVAASLAAILLVFFARRQKKEPPTGTT